MNITQLLADHGSTILFIAVLEFLMLALAIVCSIPKAKVIDLGIALGTGYEYTTYEEDAAEHRISALMKLHNINEVTASKLDEVKQTVLSAINDKIFSVVEKQDKETLEAINNEN